MPRGFIGVYLMLALITVSALGVIFLMLSGKKGNLESLPVQPKTVDAVVDPTLTPTPIPIWKIYTNEKYKFQVTYPARGVIHNTDDYSEGECGEAIKETVNGGGSTILVDNLLEIQVFPWTGTLDDYLIQRGAKNQYNFEVIEGSGALEAVKVLGLKQGAEYAIGYPPLVYIRDMYKKDNNLILLKTIPFHPNVAACVDPHLVDPVKYAKYLEQGWNMDDSLKFF